MWLTCLVISAKCAFSDSYYKLCCLQPHSCFGKRAKQVVEALLWTCSAWISKGLLWTICLNLSHRWPEARRKFFLFLLSLSNQLEAVCISIRAAVGCCSLMCMIRKVCGLLQTAWPACALVAFAEWSQDVGWVLLLKLAPFLSAVNVDDTRKSKKNLTDLFFKIMNQCSEVTCQRAADRKGSKMSSAFQKLENLAIRLFNRSTRGSSQDFETTASESDTRQESEQCSAWNLHSECLYIKSFPFFGVQFNIWLNSQATVN